ncbi:sunset domain-containing protein [Actinospongicola halichondriae]|uniref:sunset domain-containing protein n=1 Tax=Actinospongicola halichondriae TaxID=3236844 RepID=UPI003D447369
MIRRLFRLVVLAGVVAGIVATVRALTSRKDPLPAPAAPSAEPWPPLTTEPATVSPVETQPVTTAPEPDGVPIGDSTSDESSADPTTDGECPDGFPIKAKLRSKIFHAPGQLNYDRTTPDRCYADAAAAEADGLRAAKR